MELLAKLAKLTALFLALGFTYQYMIASGRFDLHYAWNMMLFTLAQMSFFVGTILIMLSGLVMMSAILFGPGAVKFWELSG